MKCICCHLVLFMCMCVCVRPKRILLFLPVFRQVHIFNMLSLDLSLSHTLPLTVTIFTYPFIKAHAYQINFGMFLIYFIFFSLFTRSYAPHQFSSHSTNRKLPLINNFIKKILQSSSSSSLFSSHFFYSLFDFSLVVCSLFCLKRNFDAIFSTSVKFFFSITIQFVDEKFSSAFCAVHWNLQYKYELV